MTLPSLLVRIAVSAMTLGAAFVCVVSIRDGRHANAISADGISTADAAELLESEGPSHLMFAAANTLDPDDAAERGLAIKLLQSGLSASPYDSSALARLSYLQTREAGQLTSAAAENLQKSIEQCGFCDRELLRWRLQFVLENWRDTPEQIRRKVFEGAEFLRWWHSDHAFLAEARAYAKRRLIPFNQYQRAVGSQIRPHELPDD
ncbi:hypothetical protein WNY37_04660 [Henriciella sp. AS95]|uniref:hypothetical protein n=1 Tax=Henriciella sp. AS95 TaxID=3135782 RepID=UPI0031734F21